MVLIHSHVATAEWFYKNNYKEVRDGYKGRLEAIYVSFTHWAVNMNRM